MNKTLWFYILFLTLAQTSQKVYAQSSQQIIKEGLNIRSMEYFWKEAVELYTMESDDYLGTLSTTFEELKYWRLKVLQDKFEVKITELEVVLSKNNFEELSQLESYVTKKGVDSLDDSLLMRLAQLNYERAGFDLAVKMKKMKDSGDYSQEMPMPDYSKTIKYLTEIIKRFPASSILDNAYYLLGYCYFDLGKEKEATAVYERMLKQFPHSKLSYEARWRLAEVYFEREEYDLAKKNYEELVAVENPFRSKALYKLAASQYASKEFAKSAQTFLNLFNESEEKQGNLDPDAETLYNESIDYLAHLKAKEIPLKLDENQDSLITKRLAQVYRGAQDEYHARLVELQFAAARPNSRYSPDFLSQVIDSFEYENKFSDAQRVRNQFLANYAPTSAFWTEHAGDVPTVVEVQDLYESILLSSADYHATLAREHKREGDYRRAIEFYNKFIDEYPTSPLRNQAKYEMADLQYFSKRYADATATYMDMTTDTENDEFREEAAYGYLLSEIKRIGFDMQSLRALLPQRDESGKLLPPTPLSKTEIGFLDATDFYLRNVRKGARRQKVLYKKAEVYFRHNDFPKVRENLELIFRDTELSAVAPKALQLLSATYNLENNWSKVVQTSKRAAEVGRRQSFESIDNESLFKAKSPTLLSAWKSEKRGDYYEAADQYEYYSILYPRAAEAPFSLLKAGQIYREIGQIQNSNRIFKRLNDDYPDNEYQTRVQFLQALNEESLLNFKQAAAQFEIISRAHKKTDLGRQALLSAAYLRKALGETETAANHYRDFALLTKDDSMLFEAAALYKKAGNHAQSGKIYDQFIYRKNDPSLAIQAYFEKASASGDLGAIDKDCGKMLTLAKKSKAGLTATAIHYLNGCDYLKAQVITDKLIHNNGKNFEKNWAVLLHLHQDINESKDDFWMTEVMHDLQRLKKVENPDQIEAQIEKIKKQLADKYVPDYDKNLLPDQKPDAESIVVNWPIESSMARVAFDQKKWGEVEKTASIEISTKPQGYLFMAMARAQAEQGNWKEARDTLGNCMQQLKEQTCTAALSILDSKVPLPKWKLSSDDAATLLLATQVDQIRKNEKTEVLKTAQKIVQINAQLPDTYKYLAQYFYHYGQEDLAQMTLEQGLRNTQNDERLLIQKGYLSLRMNDIESAESVMEDLKYKGSSEASIFRAHLAYLKGERDTAQNLLKQIKSIDPQDPNVDEAIKAQAAWDIHTKDSERIPANKKEESGEK